jgi:ubiquitin C-terminal hydrolase
LKETFGLPIQQDAHEYLLALLDVFSRELGNALTRPENTFISHFFTGDNKVEVTCKRCGFRVLNTTKFRDLTIPIRGYTDLAAAISAMTNTGDIFLSSRCEHCGTCGHLVKQSQISRWPLVLIVTLLRFDNHLRKVEEFFSFPKTLMIQGQYKYSLYAMIIHDGRLISRGHFLAFVKDDSDFWYRADDVNVYRLKDEMVMRACPYVLFYKCECV